MTPMATMLTFNMDAGVIARLTPARLCDRAVNGPDRQFDLRRIPRYFDQQRLLPDKAWQVKYYSVHNLLSFK